VVLVLVDSLNFVVVVVEVLVTVVVERFVENEEVIERVAN
jgi:hypothetical protein